MTTVVSTGTPRAFALSLADVARLSGPGTAFTGRLERLAADNAWWWIRTPGASGYAWLINTHGRLLATEEVGLSRLSGGIRPALIVH